MQQAPRQAIASLPISLVNRIAAGEVIERPASVVKELVENAIDAGATQILIETEDGGRELIRVVDNGCGIPVAELRLAFAEHATSKLRTDEDLANIATMGFRGEALASIGAVAQARILSRTADSDAAYEIFNRGGEVSDAQAAAGNVGTTVEVRNLFYNVPARRKFLKGTATESGHISEAILRLALPHPQIAFKLTSGGRKSLDLPAGDATQRLLAAWPAEYAEQRLPIDSGDAEVRLKGLVGLPEVANPTARYQYFYLNGRHIRDRFIQHALREAYRGLIEPGRQPAGILLITMPPGDVDVNVHPTKAEVRFKDSGRIHGLILASVRERLLGSDLTPRVMPRAIGQMEQAGQGGERPDMRARLADFFKQTYTPGSALANAAPGSATVLSRPADSAQFSPGIERSQNTFEDSRSLSINPGERAAEDSRAPSLPNVGERVGEDTRAPIAPNGWSARFPSMQLHNSYLVTETPEGLIIIDQHALHERIMYEDLLARLSRGPLEAQRLLIPEVIEASGREIALLEQIAPLLARLGVEVAPFGPASVAVQAFPSFLHKLNPARFIRDLLERGEQELINLQQEELLHEILDMMACKAAVKAGDPLTPAEIEALLARRDLVDRASNCPHGRPTTLRLTLADLEKQFKRTGF